jgi:RsiW-degrading membrane proteinase PrsW (M82 family)
MWKMLRLILCLIFFVPAFALLGAFATLDGGERTPWGGLVACAVVGLFFGLGFGGVRVTWSWPCCAGCRRAR